MRLSAGHHAKSLTPSTLRLLRLPLASGSSFMDADSYTLMQSSPSRANIASVCDHLKTGHCIAARSFGPANARSSLPLATSHTCTDEACSVIGDQVMRKCSHGEKSSSFTPSCPNFISFFHDGPPQRMMPRRWKHAR